MWRKLQQKWRVDSRQLLLIFCVFAITGTTTAWLTRQVTSWLKTEPSSIGYWLLKIAMLLFGYQILILIIALPFGQFAFFWKYIRRIWGRVLRRR